MTLVVAVDGPAASGKGTLARRLAAAFGLAYLDTGSLYRAAGLAALDAGLLGEENVAKEIAALASRLDLTLLSDPRLRSEQAGQAASVVAAMPPVRAALLDFQRDFAASPPEGAQGAILDGRDIGTVVCPDAEVKIYVTASVEARAQRRWKEMIELGHDVTLDAVRADLALRDARDAGRSVAPLTRADDAHLLDTSDMSIDEAFAQAKAIIEAVA